MNKHYSPSFREEIVRQALNLTQSYEEIAYREGVSVQTIHKWVARFVKKR